MVLVEEFSSVVDVFVDSNSDVNVLKSVVVDVSKVACVEFVTVIILPSKVSMVEAVIGLADVYTADLGLNPGARPLLTDPKDLRDVSKVVVTEYLVEKLELGLGVESLVGIFVESKATVCLLVGDIVDLVTKAVLFLTVKVVVSKVDWLMG